MMPESDPSRLQSELEITAPWSSANHWPTMGLTPRFRAREGVTAAPATCSGWPANVMLKLAALNQPNTSKLRVRC